MPDAKRKKARRRGAVRASSGLPNTRKKPQFLAEKAYQELRNCIMTGEYLPGARLGEEVLVERLGVSRTVVRQVLTQLVSEGLAKNDPGRGKTVIEHSAEALAQLLPIRISLEQLAVRLAVERMTDADMDELRRMALRFRDPEMDLAEQDALDVRFHRFLWASAGNSQLEEMLHRVAGPFHLASHATMLSSIGRRAMAAASWQQILLEHERHAGGHQLLVDAICRRDADAAARAIEKHLTFNYESSPDEYNRRIAQLMRKYKPRDTE